MVAAAPAPATPLAARAYAPREELVNAASHGLGAAIALAGLTLLIVQATRDGRGRHLASAIVYGVTLVVLFGASTLYHSILAPRARHVFKIFDHAAIYLLIAGTYTPFTLVTLRGRGGLGLFAVVWSCALVGVALEAFWVYRPKWLSVVVYVAMGWLVVFLIRPLAASLPPGGLWLLVAGGLAYTLGTPFYALKRARYAHAVWHLFVLGGAACHFLAVFGFVLRA